MIYHGKEVFDSKLMDEYATWDIFSHSFGKFLVYLGKSSELVAGISIFLGLHTRVGSTILMGTMLYITFFVGQGRFWYEEQHPFMFVMMGLVFFFYGSGTWSVDEQIVKRNQKS